MGVRPFLLREFLNNLGVGGSADEETEWANYRLSEGKGIMLWNNF